MLKIPACPTITLCKHRRTDGSRRVCSLELPTRGRNPWTIPAVTEVALPMFRDYRTWVYGKSSFDQTHALVFNYVWDLPNLGQRTGNAVLGPDIGSLASVGRHHVRQWLPTRALTTPPPTMPTSREAEMAPGSMSLARPNCPTENAPSAAGSTLQSSAGRPRDILETRPKTCSAVLA